MTLSKMFFTVGFFALALAPLSVAQDAGGGGSDLTASWYFKLDGSAKKSLTQKFKREPFTELMTQLPEGLYYQDQRESFGRPEIAPGQLIDEVSVELPGLGLVYAGFAAKPTEPREFWLVSAKKARFHLATYSDAKKEWVTHPFLPLPVSEQNWVPVPGGALSLNEGWHLYFQHHDRNERLKAKTIDGKPVLVKDGEAEGVQARVGIRQVTRERAEPLWYINRTAKKVLFASLKGGQADKTAEPIFDLVLYDFATGSSEMIHKDISWPLTLTNRGVFFEKERNIHFLDLDWATGKLKDKAPRKIYALAEKEVYKSTITEFTIARPNSSGNSQEYSLTPDGTLQRFSRATKRFKKVDVPQHQRIQEFEVDGSSQAKVDMLEELESGARTFRYGIPAVAEQISTALGGSKRTFAIVTYKDGQLPDDVIVDFIWRLKTGAVPANKDLSSVNRVYQFTLKHFDLPEAEEVNTRIRTVSEVAKGTESLVYFANFPAATKVGAGAGAERLNTFNNHFGECIEEGTCRVLFSIKEEVYNELFKTHEELFAKAKVIKLPVVSPAEAKTIAESHRLYLERKTNRRLTKESAEGFYRFLNSEGYRVSDASPERELGAVDELFDYLAAFNPTASQIDDKVLRSWIDHRGGSDFLRQKMDPKAICAELKNDVVGSDEVVEQLCNLLVMIKEGNRLKAEGPLAKFVYIGPSGTGKTYIPEEFARLVFGEKNKIVRIDMANFKGLDRTSKTAQALQAKGLKIALFDDIDQLKSAQSLQQLAEIMDTGFYAKGTTEEIDFTNTIVFWTANWAQEVINQSLVADGGTTVRDKVRDYLTLENGKPDPILNPRIWGRIESVIHIFPRFTQPELLEVALVTFRKQLEEINRTTGKKVRIEPGVFVEIVAAEKNAKTGARAATSRLERMVFGDPAFVKAFANKKIQKIVVLQNADATSSSRIEVLTDEKGNFDREWDNKDLLDTTGWAREKNRAFVLQFLKDKGKASGIPQEEQEYYLKKYDGKK